MKLFIEEYDEYDEYFGEPTTQVLDISQALKFFDDVINLAEKSKRLKESSSNEHNFEVKRIVMTSLFERAVKQLYKKKKISVLKELKETIIKLANYEIQAAKSNHPLKNAKGHIDLHIEGGNLILLYKYINDEVVGIDIDKSSFEFLLKLQDIVDHKQLKNYDTRKYDRKTKDLEIDKLFTDLDGE